MIFEGDSVANLYIGNGSDHETMMQETFRKDLTRHRVKSRTLKRQLVAYADEYSHSGYDIPRGIGVIFEISPVKFVEDSRPAGYTQIDNISYGYR